LKLYVDLDGVLADFDTPAEEILGTDNIYKYEFIWGPEKFWAKINEHPNFFRDLPTKADAYDLWDSISHLDPSILTALPKTNPDRVDLQKREFVSGNFGDATVITCETEDKPDYCEPGDILIDDRAVNRDAWMKKGGIYLVHTTAARTVAALQALGVI
jgi:hypothetical protein